MARLLYCCQTPEQDICIQGKSWGTGRRLAMMRSWIATLTTKINCQGMQFASWCNRSPSYVHHNTVCISDHLSKAASLLIWFQKAKWCPALSLGLQICQQCCHFMQLQQTLEGNFYVLCTAFRPRATQTHLVAAELDKSHLTDASVKTRGYFSNAIEPIVGGSAFTKMSLARIATASSFAMASVPEKQCSMYSRKHGRKCWRDQKKKKGQRLESLLIIIKSTKKPLTPTRGKSKCSQISQQSIGLISSGAPRHQQGL